MSRLRRCLSGSASLSLALAGCFSPTGSVTATTGDSDVGVTLDVTTSTGTTGAPSTTDATTDPDTSATTSTSPSAASTAEPTTTGGSSSGTGASSSTGAAVCGNAMVEPGEQCDAGKDNAVDGPCRPDCSPATCGDGVRCRGCDPIEECDDTNLRPGDGCSPACLLEGRLMFLTPTTWPGNVTTMQADQVCQELGAAEFDSQRTFIAWLSTSTDYISGRIGSSDAPYLLPRGDTVALGTKALLNGEVLHAVDQVPSGDTIAGQTDCAAPENLVWTGSNIDGTATIAHCNNWTLTTGVGWAGFYSAVGHEWSLACDPPCSSSLRLYCIETTL